MKFAFYCCTVTLMPGEAGRLFGDNLERFGDLATFLANNEYSRNLKFQDCNINRKLILLECSRSLAKLGTLHAKLDYK